MPILAVFANIMDRMQMLATCLVLPSGDEKALRQRSIATALLRPPKHENVALVEGTLNRGRKMLDELRESVAFATGAGVARERIIIDPGLGFAKEPAHTYEVLARLDEFSELGRPLLVGPSRKRFLNRPLGSDVPAAAREWATAAAVAAAVFAGAHIVRVHSGREMAQVTRVSDEIRKYHRG